MENIKPKNENESKDQNEVLFLEESDIESNESQIKYVKNDDEEEKVMIKMANKNKDFDLLENLINGDYFTNKKFLSEKRKKYGVVREKEIKVENEYRMKYLMKLEENDNRLRSLNQKNKNYKLEYYNLLEIGDESEKEIVSLQEKIHNLENLLLESRKENRELEKKNNELAVRVGDLEFENMENERKFQNILRNQRKEEFKKSMTKCQICFCYYYKKDISFISCGHFMCKGCFTALNKTTCPICGKKRIWVVNPPHYDDDLNSEDFNQYEKYNK